MTDELFDIFFSGKILGDNDPEIVKNKVGEAFNANSAVLEQLFSGNPVKIKKSVDMDTAIKYRVKFRDIGAIVDIRPSGQTAPAASPAAVEKPAPATQTPSASAPPPPSAESQPAPVSLDSSLAAPGAVIDETPDVPPAQIATDQFELGQANQGSLEEFAEHVEPAVIPDISSLDVSTSEEPLDATPPPEPLEVDVSNMHIDAFSGPLDDTPPPAPANIDTSSLSASAPNTGSLEEFDSRPEPVPIPDTSKLEIE